MKPKELKMAAERWATGGIVPTDMRDSAGLFTCQIHDAVGARHVADDYLRLLSEVERLQGCLDDIATQLQREGQSFEHLMALAMLGKHTTVVGISLLKSLLADADRLDWMDQYPHFTLRPDAAVRQQIDSARGDA